LATWLQIGSALYLAAALAAAAGVLWPSNRLRILGTWLLGFGTAAHTAAFGVMHAGDPLPLADLATAVSMAVLLANLFLLVSVLRFRRLAGLVALLAPLAFVGTFLSALTLPDRGPDAADAAVLWSHSHVLLGSAGLALLAVAGLAGGLLLVEDRRLKAKRPLRGGVRLPSIEALDRINTAALGLGFLCLTVGVVTGALWVHAREGVYYTGSPHELWTTVAWSIYLVLVLARFLLHQDAREAALSAVAGFAFLVFAVVGVGVAT